MTHAGLLLWLTLVATEPAHVVVQPGETLSQVAKRALGDERCASELKALNQLTSDEIRAGMTLKLPGPDRTLASSAMTAARHAVSRVTAGPKRQDAAAKLNQAEELFASARYADAAKTADSAWQLVSENADQPTRFSVEVSDAGTTLVSARSGQAVRVEAEGVAEPVYPGHSVSVEKGHPPVRPEETPLPPPLIAPADQARLKLRAADNGLLAPVVLSWKPVPGVKSYQVTVLSEWADNAQAADLKVAKTEARLPPLAAGKYSWSVQSLGETVKSERSGWRTFELAPDTLKLDVKGTTWK